MSEKYSAADGGGILFFRAPFSLILRSKINENGALEKFYSAAEGGRILMRHPPKRILFGGASRQMTALAFYTTLNYLNNLLKFI